MQKNVITKLFYLIAFLVMMGISSWATGESFSLLLGWPLWTCCLLAALIFVISSMGCDLMVGSFSRDFFGSSRERTLRFLGGLIMLLVAWGVFSFPTNTHTFLYTASVKNVLALDLDVTKNALDDMLKSPQTEGYKLKEKMEQAKTKLTILKNVYLNEIVNPVNKGVNHEADKKLRDFNNELVKYDGEEIKALSGNPKTMKECREYVASMNALMQPAIESTVTSYFVTKAEKLVDGKDQKEIKAMVDQITKDRKYLEANMDKMIPDDTFKAMETHLAKCYTKISERTGKDYFKGQPRAQRLRSVKTVWADWWNDASHLKEYDFTLWILLSLVVDLAGFVFFVKLRQ